MKGSDTSDHILLRKVQHMSLSTTLSLTMSMTLQKRDYGTRIYCTKDTWPDMGNATRQESENHLIGFKTYSTLETPIVTVMPNISSYIFEVDSNITTFICNGTKPVDGRKLTWYIQETNSKPKHLETQVWDNASFINILPLELNETYHRKKLFCAQDFEFKYTHPNGTFYIEGYNELARSNMITLLHKEIKANEEEDISTDEDSSEESEESGGDGNGENNMSEGLKFNHGQAVSPLVYAIPIFVVAVLLVAATVWFICRRGRTTRPAEKDDECVYATPKVNYVTLDLKNPTSEYASSLAQDQSPYAQIIGVYKPDLNQQRT
ncbi:uncharacterized protein LOC133532994 [Cydia pomonella]|uniref:uncharacterized protein LOC133532994 n=1 Tax=Cydia pomonella TaxID=82600 RepID=UPI002ADE7C34|nr:uncharacterized protein LOC133532994 [Cydia pomonella]